MGNKIMIDSFDPSTSTRAIIKRNEDTSNQWDLEEDLGFITFPDESIPFSLKVIETNNPNADRIAFEILKCIYNYIYELKKCLRDTLLFNPLACTKVRDEMILFIITRCTIQEIPVNKKFEGLNKPRDIVYNEDNLDLEKDNQYRAGKRHILFKIRSSNNKFKSWKNLKQLLLHELSHTCCNHIEYWNARNHAKDFDRCESFLKQFCAKCFTLKNIEDEIIRLNSLTS
jgi:hypothetical protein